MITGGKIISVEAKRDNDAAVTGLSINIGLDEVKVTRNEVEIKYTYSVTYAEKVGSLKIVGVLYAEEDDTKAKEIAKRWGDSKTLPDDFAEITLNTINFTCGTNGTLVVRPVNLSPPMIPPRIQLAKGGATGRQSA